MSARYITIEQKETQHGTVYDVCTWSDNDRKDLTAFEEHGTIRSAHNAAEFKIAAYGYQRII